MFDNKLTREFYLQETTAAAKAILGKVLVHCSPQGLLAGRIIETEAYLRDDPACHASRGPAKRCLTMFGEPGHAYVYLNYGVHYCLNLVTQAPGIPEAILVRAIVPLEGIEIMKSRRGVSQDTQLCSGPGKLTCAMGIDGSFDGEDLLGDRLFVVNDGAPRGEIVARPRIGIREATDRLWRFYLKEYSAWVSRP